MKLFSILLAILLLATTATAVYLGEDTERQEQKLRGLRPADTLPKEERQALKELRKAERRAENEQTYIVTLKKGVDADLVSLDMKGRAAKVCEKAMQDGGKIGHVYERAIKGFSITLPKNKAEKIMKQLVENPNVLRVDEDVIEEPLTQTYHWGHTTVNANIRADGIDNGNVDADIAIIDSGTNDPSTNRRRMMKHTVR
ncbi:MAG: hypothetical protein SGARI_004525 [Bacillariaceae sp.]